MSTAIQQATQQLAATQQQAKPAASLKDLVNKMKGEIAKALPSVITPERFTRITLSALSKDPKLQKCTPASFMAAMMTAAQLGVEPNTPLGQAYLIPYNRSIPRKDSNGNDVKINGKTQWDKIAECQFQLGYKGLLDLAYRSGDISVIQAHTVYAKDEFDYQFGLEAKLTHKPCMDPDKGDPIAFYAMFKTKDGGYGFDVMSIADVKAHRDRFSKAVSGGSSSPWDTNFEEMAKKTVLKRVLKYAPIKSDFARVVAADETIKTSVAEDMLDVTPEPVTYAEAEIIDPETGEVLNQQQAATTQAPAQPQEQPAADQQQTQKAK